MLAIALQAGTVASRAAQAPAAPPSPTAPAVGSATANSNQPVQIQADSGVEWDQNAHLYIARGNAVAIRGPSEVHADTIIAHYRDMKGGGNTGANTEIYRVEAEGHVTLRRNDDTVVGDQAVYDVDSGIAVVTGNGLKLTTPADWVTARDSLEWYDQKQIAVARGDAVAVRNDRTVKGDVLTAYLHKSGDAGSSGAAPTGKPGAQGTKPVSAASPKPPAAQIAAKGSSDPNASKISRVDAQGHVVISNPVEAGRGDFGVYNADTGIATLIGNVIIERGKDVIRGQRGVMDLNRHVSRVLPGRAPGMGTATAAGAAAASQSRVQGLFVRSDQGGTTAMAGPRGDAVSRPVAASGKKQKQQGAQP